MGVLEMELVCQFFSVFIILKPAIEADRYPIARVHEFNRELFPSCNLSFLPCLGIGLTGCPPIERISEKKDFKQHIVFKSFQYWRIPDPGGRDVFKGNQSMYPSSLLDALTLSQPFERFWGAVIEKMDVTVALDDEVHDTVTAAPLKMAE
jgi:hypothetical protein